jgi:hypothetical protein
VFMSLAVLVCHIRSRATDMSVSNCVANTQPTMLLLSQYGNSNIMLIDVLIFFS